MINDIVKKSIYYNIIFIFKNQHSQLYSSKNLLYSFIFQLSIIYYYYVLNILIVTKFIQYFY
jgi:hypothetical protein